MFDCHVHTKYSSDSKMTVEEVIEKIRNDNDANGENGIIITEHMDIDFPGDDKMFKFNIKSYFKEYEKYKNHNIGLGIELGLQQNCLSKLKNIIKYNEFDYVIGSIHIVDNTDIYLKEYYDGKTKQEAYNQYFDNMIYCIDNFKDYDSLGHIDYISRYSPYDDREINYEEFKDKIEIILKTLIDDSKCIELNTKRLNEASAITSYIKILQRYRELGGMFVTLGSDAHTSENIGKNFLEGLKIIHDLSLKQVIFKKRKLTMV